MLISLLPEKSPPVSLRCAPGARLPCLRLRLRLRVWAARFSCLALAVLMSLAGCVTRQPPSAGLRGRASATQAFPVVLLEGGWDAEQRYLSDSEWSSARDLILASLANAISNRPSTMAPAPPAIAPSASIFVFVAPPRNKIKYGPQDPCVGHVAIYRHPGGVYVARLDVATPREYVYFVDKDCVQALVRNLGLTRQPK